VTIDQAQRREINGISVPLLKGGDSDLHENNAIVDDFLTRTGAIATLFVRSGDDFVRVATSLRKENGDRAIGTKLDKASPAFAPALKGETYRGLALLFGKRYITQYQPVKDNNGNTIAILFVGVDITHSWEIMRSKILGASLAIAAISTYWIVIMVRTTVTICSTPARRVNAHSGMNAI
jgi:hypothetical protein